MFFWYQLILDLQHSLVLLPLLRSFICLAFPVDEIHRNSLSGFQILTPQNAHHCSILRMNSMRTKSFNFAREVLSRTVTECVQPIVFHSYPSMRLLHSGPQILGVTEQKKNRQLGWGNDNIMAILTQIKYFPMLFRTGCKKYGIVE